VCCVCVCTIPWVMGALHRTVADGGTAKEVLVVVVVQRRKSPTARQCSRGSFLGGIGGSRARRVRVTQALRCL